MVHNSYNCKEKLVILESIRITAIKSSGTRVVIYTCRYPSRQFNPLKNKMAVKKSAALFKNGQCEKKLQNKRGDQEMAVMV